MRVLLVNMPWSPIDLPSLALGILKRSVDERVPGATAEVLHANLAFTDWITERTEFTGDDYEYYALSSYFMGCGDWVFSSALYDDPEWRDDEFTGVMTGKLKAARMKMTRALHRIVPEFVEMIAQQVVASGPDVVGFTSTFQQNTAALACARRVKELAPHLVTVMGGANCDGEQGAAVHRNFDFVDHVVRGEGEAAFPALLTALTERTPLDDIPGLCHRDATGKSVANPMATRPLPPAAILPPDYSGYFERLAASVARNWVEPKLVVEGARGCWWGEKHHCTFCGLNGSFMEFRSKSPDTFYEEIMDLARRHKVLDMYVVDNILDMRYLTTVLPRIIESGYDLRLHIEIKANMKRSQLRTLAEAGLIYVQPGIESLNSRVLDLMDKGVSGCQNVRMLRDGAETGLSVAWNYLHGFPGESAEDYDPVIAQIPALEHLDPPVDLSARIAIERFSPYFERPELGFTGLRPEGHYRFTYDLPEEELYGMAYVFEAPARGIGEPTVKALNEALADWRTHHTDARLTHDDHGDRIVLVSRRRTFSWRAMELTDPFELAVFRLLDQPHSVQALLRKAAARVSDMALDETRLQELLDSWLALGIVFSDAGQYVHIAPAAVNEDLLRLDFMRHIHAEPEPEPEPARAGGAR
ncbi:MULTISPECIES: RiPP maturation radical SAM C-methyltransferase [unclassified Streptomyces]|uniref:RiPP maturation radical SAM C-methyltransferase n=1 Tax=unclassified Streptomyces TaxID=2593676 RepID=UPI0013701644|nr:RiPP maturation radical SAM protein 1 [Streptomyces sp. SID335]MYZ18434.1 RiPP maturation radical SAM protein 1 [Streptomyces sp. SID337]NDZ88617.1 RiPP maturation radical SAM protein 1 [Streptomyces sp. SID10115]NEA01917.1 RiPP maturation radical SAM protein 1 [Streptomyces sp. SID10116]NEB44083.1 RiPP maturation radical SAM protein 1 [Streptomyces sp. SID339]